MFLRSQSLKVKSSKGPICGKWLSLGRAWLLIRSILFGLFKLHHTIFVENQNWSNNFIQECSLSRVWLWLYVWGQIDLGSTQRALIVKCQHHIKICHIDPPTFQHNTTHVIASQGLGMDVGYNITWASVRFSLDASKTRSGPTMYWVLKYM